MIEFIKNVSKALPYDREEYFKFLDEELDLSIKWYGISFQILPNSKTKKIELSEFIKVYKGLIKDVVMKFNSGTFWIVNHEDKDLPWFPNESKNLTHLRTLFKERNVTNKFKGALILNTDDLLKYSEDLISYPYVVLNKSGFLYKDLNISHGELQFIIKISGHLNIDFLSTKTSILKNVLNLKYSSKLIVKEYRGTNLD